MELATSETPHYSLVVPPYEAKFKRVVLELYKDMARKSISHPPIIDRMHVLFNDNYQIADLFDDAITEAYYESVVFYGIVPSLEKWEEEDYIYVEENKMIEMEWAENAFLDDMCVMLDALQMQYALPMFETYDIQNQAVKGVW